MNSETIKNILDMLNQHGLETVAIAFLLAVVFWLARVVMDKDRSDLWRARIYLLVYKLTKKRDAEKKYISNDVRGRINSARKRIHVGKHSLPEAVSVDWVDESAGTSYEIAEGEFVVRLHRSDEQEKNMVDLALAVARRTTLRGVRHVIAPAMERAIDLEMVRSILKNLDNTPALEWFFSNRYIPLLESDPQLRKEAERMTELDERGLFAAILLTELEEFGRSIIGKSPRPYMWGEIEGFVSFLYTIATRPFGQEVPLSYGKAILRVGIVLVAKTRRLLSEGTEPYVTAMYVSAKREMNSVYVLAYDKDMLAESNPDAYDNYRITLEDLDDEILRSVPAKRDFSVDYTCIDQEGKIRRAACTRYVFSR